MTSKKRYPSGAREGDGFLFSVHIWIPEGDPRARKVGSFSSGLWPTERKRCSKRKPISLKKGREAVT